MAALALSAELTEVNVVVAVTGGAIGRQLHRARGAAMTIAAAQTCVSAGQRKLRLLVVIEVPQAPAIG